MGYDDFLITQPDGEVRIDASDLINLLRELNKNKTLIKTLESKVNDLMILNDIYKSRAENIEECNSPDYILDIKV